MKTPTASSKGPSTRLLSTSKQIKKSRGKATTYSSGSASPSSSVGAEKKYQTFDNNTRILILQHLRRAIIMHLRLPSSEEDISAPGLLQCIDKIPLDDYNKMLKCILEDNVNGFIADTKTLTTWRKKIKGWVNSSEKPETRGGLVVAPQQAEEFKRRIHLVLEKLPYRAFEDLKNKILAVLKEFHQKKNKEDEFSEKTCSKHWWFNFCSKNEDIGKKWKSLPLERSVGKNSLQKETKCKKQNSNQSSPTRSSTEDTVETQYMSPESLKHYPAAMYSFPSPTKELQYPSGFESRMEEEGEEVFCSPSEEIRKTNEFSLDYDQEPFSPSRYLYSNEKVDLFKDDKDDLFFGEKHYVNFQDGIEDKFDNQFSLY